MTDATTINDAQTIAGGGTGTVLAGRYRVIRQLGHGGMGSVWLAEDIQLDNKPFAVKMLPSILVSNKRAYRQLKDEALVAMKLVHPNIVQIRAFEENNGNPFLVMDYIDGQTLDDYLAEKGKLSEDEVIRILKPIASALDYAHGEGVVHRDVKPANVMIRKDGYPFILDFGIAREIQETMTRVTGKLSSGTLLYMSPEQLHGASPKKEQDIYSFAAMAYECLKGESPFSRGQIEYQIDNDLPEPLPNSPSKIEGVAVGRGSMTIAPSVMAGLAKNPEDRPKSCAAVLEGENFNHVEHAERVGGDGVSHKERKEREDGGAWKAFLAAALIGIAVVGGLWWMERFRGTGERQVTNTLPKQEPPVVPVRPTGGESDAACKAAATEIRIDAKVQQARVERISDADGFRSRKDELTVQFSCVDALFDEKVRRWSEAAQGFSNYVANAKALIKLDGERQKAVDARGKAEKSKSDAEQADAEKYAATRWNEAVKLFESAKAEFGTMQFVSAERLFALVAEQFVKCADVAKEEYVRKDRVKKINVGGNCHVEFVCLGNGVWMMRNPILWREYIAVVGKASADITDADVPATNVSWDDCKSFLERFPERVRLPDRDELKEFVDKSSVKREWCSGINVTQELGMAYDFASAHTCSLLKGSRNIDLGFRIVLDK